MHAIIGVQSKNYNDAEKREDTARIYLRGNMIDEISVEESRPGIYAFYDIYYEERTDKTFFFKLEKVGLYADVEHKGMNYRCRHKEEQFFFSNG
jgi:hypothetical protein